MAIRNDLMNTQTGGEGETVQIQAQEQVTPEQFDVNIKAQETPTEPPVQRQMTEQEVPVQPSQFWEDQQSFAQNPEIQQVEQPEAIATENIIEQEPALPSHKGQHMMVSAEQKPETQTNQVYSPFVSNSTPLDLDENGNVISKEETLIPSHELPTEFVDDPLIKSSLQSNNIYGNVKAFKDTEKEISNDLKNSELGNVVNMYDVNKEPGDGIFGKIKKFFKKEEEKPNIDNIGGIDVRISDVNELSKDELIEQGIDISEPIPDPTQNTQQTEASKEGVSTEEDYTNLINEEGIIGEFNKLLLEKEKLQKEIKEAQGKDLKSLRKNLNNIKQSLKDLQKSDDFKTEKEKYAQNALKKGGLPADYYIKQEKVPIITDLTYHPSNYRFWDPFKNVGMQIFGRSIEKSDDYYLYYNGYENADDILKGFFYNLPANKKPTDLYNPNGGRGEYNSWTFDDEAKQKVTYAIMGWRYAGKDLGVIETRPPLTYEEAKQLDAFWRDLANKAKSNDGKFKEAPYKGMLKTVLFPPDAYLPPVTLDLKDHNGVWREITLFQGIYDTPENRNKVRNGFGSPWNKQSFQYKYAEYTRQPYWVPGETLRVWNKTIKGFDIKTFRQQQRLAIKKDKEGKPYLQSDAGVFGVGITGVMDNATRTAQKRYDADLKKQKYKPDAIVAGDITLKGEFDFGPKKVESFKTAKDFKNSNLTFGNFNAKDIPVEKMKSTSDATIWATNHLSTATKFEETDPNIFEKDQNSFKQYIDGLGLKGINVVPLGGWLYGDLDYVRLDGVGKSLIIDLGEGDINLNRSQLKRLSDWLSVAQDDPRNDFIEAYTASFDKDLYVSKTINEKTKLGETFTLSFPNQRGETITVTNKSGQLDAQQYLNEIEFNNAYYQEIKNGVEENVKNYNNQIQPYVQKFQNIQDQSNKEIASLEKQLNDLDYKHNNDKIKDEDFQTQAKLIDDKIIKIKNNLTYSYNELKKALGGNELLLEQINKDYERLETAGANLNIINEDINELAGIEMARLMADNTGPKTIVGHIVGAYTNGYMKPFVAAISAGSDALIALGFHPEGMTKEEAYKQNNEWKANFLYGTFTDALESSLGTKMSVGYESRLSFGGKAVYGAFESVGTQANPLVRTFRGTPLQGIASMIGFASQSYTQIDEEIVKNPDLKDIPEYQKKLMALPYAIIMSAIDKYGYSKLTSGKSSVTQRLMVSVLNQALKQAPKNATLETIEAIIKGDVKSNIGKFILAANRAGITEMETEALQAASLDVGFKELWDNILEHDAFNKGAVFEDFVKMVIDQGKAGYIGGLALGGAMRSVEYATTNKVKLINQEDYDFFKLVSSDPNLKKAYANSVANKFASGDIDKAQAEKMMVDFENLIALDKKVADQITGKSRVEMVDLMLQKQKIQEKMSELDDTQKKLYDPALKLINDEMQRIVSETETKIKEEQQYDKENESRLPSEEPTRKESVETELITKPGQEEVSPSGMVQEEQTEITPAEVVSTEAEVTPAGEAVTETEVTPTEEMAKTEATTEVAAKNEFDELADINKITSPAKKNKAMKAFNEKYGEKATRISQIDSNFTSIVSKLESQKIITKKC